MKTRPKVSPRLEGRILAQQEKLARIDEQLGALMSKRAIEEEKLADLLERRNSDGQDPVLA